MWEQTGVFLGGGGGGHPPPLEDFVPPLGDPKKNCFRVTVLAFCSYLPQIPIRVILTCQVSFLIALDAISEHLKFKIFWGEDPPDPPKACVRSAQDTTHQIHFAPPQNQKFPFCPPLGEFSKKNTGRCHMMGLWVTDRWEQTSRDGAVDH